MLSALTETEKESIKTNLSQIIAPAGRYVVTFNKSVIPGTKHYKGMKAAKNAVINLLMNDTVLYSSFLTPRKTTEDFQIADYHKDIATIISELIANGDIEIVVPNPKVTEAAKEELKEVDSDNTTGTGSAQSEESGQVTE